MLLIHISLTYAILNIHTDFINLKNSIFNEQKKLNYNWGSYF